MADWYWVAVGLLAIAASIAILGNQFANDDILLIENNERVHGLQLGQIFSNPYWPPPFSQDLYRPLTSVLHSLEYVVGFGSPGVFRVVTVVGYVAVALGVFLLLARLVSRPAAFFGACVFAVHPVHVEAIALAVAQNELIVGLIAIFLVMRYVELRKRGGPSIGGWVSLAMLVVAAALFKETGFVLPALLISAEVFVIQRPRQPEAVRLLVGSLVFVIAVGLVLALRWRVLHEFAGTFVNPALAGASLRVRTLTMLRVIPQWARLLVWPAHLRADYSPQEISASTTLGAPEAFGGLLFVFLVGQMWSNRKDNPSVAFGIAWIIVALLPVSNILIPTGVLVAERTLFLPTIGFAIVLAGLVSAYADFWRKPSIRPAVVPIVTALAVGGVARSIERDRVWRNEGFLTVRTVQDSPRSFRAQRDYGNTLFQLDAVQPAIEAYRRAIALAPESERWSVRNELARHYRGLGRTADEIRELRASLGAVRRQEKTQADLIIAYLYLGHYSAAASAADTALAMGESPSVFKQLRSVADSATRVGALPGTVRIGIVTGAPAAKLRE